METRSPDQQTVPLEGLWVPLVTPFAASGAIDEPSFERLAARVLDDGAAGLVALGTTGEPATLSPDERDRVVEIAGDVAASSASGLIAGAGSNDTTGTIAEIERLAALTMLSGVLVVVPYYSRPSEQAIVEHFLIVADASPVPVVAYNVPYRTGRGLGADALVKLGDHENIIGLKQATGALDLDTLEVLRQQPADFAILAGDDAFIAPTMLLGATGAIAAAAHLCTPLFVELVSAASTGDVATARELATRLLPVVTAGFAEPNPAVWKAALAELGEIETSGVRRPLTRASTQATCHLIEAMKSALQNKAG